jgi:hypothetical protein
MTMASSNSMIVAMITSGIVSVAMSVVVIVVDWCYGLYDYTAGLFYHSLYHTLCLTLIPSPTATPSLLLIPDPIRRLPSLSTCELVL